MRLSIVIPVYNEEENIGDLIRHLKSSKDERLSEVIVVDAGSSDGTLKKAGEEGALCLISAVKGRASQMNHGAAFASGNIFYFVHADSFPPASYVDDIFSAVRNGYHAGCYRYRFNSGRLLLKLNSWFTRFDRIMCRGGDQTLFITRELFEELGGFRNDYLIMEDYDLIQKIQRASQFMIFSKEAIVSARKYEKNSYLRVNFANFVVFMMYFAGASQNTMVHAYKSLIYHPKF
jgi:rSAM/selenodomain-associated transferase 2